MSRPISKPKPPVTQPAWTGRYPPRPPASPPEVVDPVWIVKALGLTLAVAVVLAYLAVCLLVWQGNWQLILHPSTKVDRTPASAGLAYDAVRFDAAEAGRPRLAGWWIPGHEPLTLLYLHGASSSLADTLPTLARLHDTGVNVFAIDYRGYGQSDGPHPTEARMTEDVEAALDYLENTRHLSSAAIVPYGNGVGAVLAARLAATHAELPALVVDTPDLAAEHNALESQRSRLLPMRLLLRSHFDLPAAMQGVSQPKLLFTQSPSVAINRDNEALFRRIRSPKLSVSLPAMHSDAAYREALLRFFDEYLPPADLQR